MSRFADRVEAGAALAREFEHVLDEGTVVIGLARGGVAVAAVVARALELPLDALAVRKVRHPWQPEYALGAVAAGAPPYLRTRDGLREQQWATAIEQARADAAVLERTLRDGRPRTALAGRSVVLVDDGLATGATMIAAARWARWRGARHVVVAAPIGARKTVELLRREADEVVCPWPVDDLGAVGQWYVEFPQLTDAEVIELLRAARDRRLVPSAG